MDEYWKWVIYVGDIYLKLQTAHCRLGLKGYVSFQDENSYNFFTPQVCDRKTWRLVCFTH